MCKGLAYAHDMLNPETNAPFGIVHRDISPPNVLISKQGEVKVVDFGLAKATSQVEITDPGVVKGKMSYLSPEAARGEEVDHRADIFAVGILLYELLTGKRLFYGETDYQTVELVRNAKIPPIKPQNPQVEPELEDIVRKALSKRKEDRYQNATDIQDALAQYAYSRGLKVIARDIAELVRQCLEDKRMQSSEGKGKTTSIIDHLLQAEIAKFTSVEEDEQDAGARPLSADELAPRAGTISPPSDGDFVDPRAWAEERLTPVLGIAEVDAMEARKTSRDVPPVAPTPAARRPSQARVPTPQPARPLDPMDQTPGPETLASVLEPTPGPEALPPEALSATLEPPPTRAVAIKANRPHKGRNFLIGAVIGIVLLGAIVVLAKRNTPAAPPAPASTSPTAPTQAP
jgi:serine/threonine-protein kinase